MRHKLVNRSRGFSLMEILVVLAIISILSAIATPNFMTTLRNYRLRAATMQLLTAIRETRTLAMSNLRQFKLTVNTDTFTYSRERLPFKQINIMKLPLEEYLYEDTAAELADLNAHPENKDVKFNYQNGILSMATIPNTGFELIFNPSGTIVIPSTGFADIKTYGRLFGYQIKIYKGGQISLHQTNLP